MAQVNPETTNAERELLVHAQSGDEQAFNGLTQPLQRELHAHCYRMLGTIADADDAVQETMLRAWRNLAQFTPHAPFRAWVYRIATNVCLTSLERRSRRGEVPLTGDDSIDAGHLRTDREPLHLQPYPDRLLEAFTAAVPGPEAAVETAESIELAFVTAVQLLPPRQRATLLLRDVIGFPATEVAPMLETSVAAVNSTLQRARGTLAKHCQTNHLARPHSVRETVSERDLVHRLVASWQAADVPAIVDLLTEDALFSMPPQPRHFIGRAAIAAFLSGGPAGGRLDRFRLVPVRANGQPALAAYWRGGESGPFLAHGLLVIALAGDSIASITRFGDMDLFARFALPMAIDDGTAPRSADRGAA